MSSCLELSTPESFTDCVIREKDFYRKTYTKCVFRQIKFKKCRFSIAQFIDCEFCNVQFVGSELYHAEFVETKFEDCNLKNDLFSSLKFSMVIL